MQLTVTNIPEFELPVVATIPTPDADVRLYLQSLKYQSGDAISGTTFVPITGATYTMSNPIPIGNQYNYATILKKKHLPNPGYYFGYIEATNKNVDPNRSNPPIFRENIVIEVKEPELAYTSKVAGPDGNLSYSELLETLYARNIQLPLPYYYNDKGHLVMEMVSGPALPLVFKNVQNGGALPQGTYARIYNKKNGNNVNLNVPSYDGKKSYVVKELMLGVTDASGTPLGVNYGKPITNGEASYTFVYGLPVGEYYAVAYYEGKPITSPINFSFPLENC